MVLRSGANPNADEQHPRYNVFVEVEAKQAAKDCGSGLTTDETTWRHWDKIWNREAKMIDQNTLWPSGLWSGDAPGSKGEVIIHISGTRLDVEVREGTEWRIQADTWNQVPIPSDKRAEK